MQYWYKSTLDFSRVGYLINEATLFRDANYSKVYIFKMENAIIIHE